MTQTRPVDQLVFLKLGGALVTDKRGHEAVRADVLARLAREVAAWYARRDASLVLAHGSGSFAHQAVTATGLLERPADPMRLATVAAAARRLSIVVCDTLLAAGLPALPIPGSLLAVCRGGRVARVRLPLVTDALAAGLLPVVYGDAAPDPDAGATIADTETLLATLARSIQPAPSRLILATDVDGVFRTDPALDAAPTPIAHLDPTRPEDRALAAGLGAAPVGVVDVTGGMAAKVRTMLDLVADRPRTEVRIVSGLRPGAVAAALTGEPEAGGTLLAIETGQRPCRRIARRPTAT
jgi:isopentenyl phosphate kinase